MSSLQQWLRPPSRLLRYRNATAAASYARLYSIARAMAATEAHVNNKTGNNAESLQTRAEALLSSGRELYPRFPKDAAVENTSCQQFLKRFDFLANDQTTIDVELALQGKVKSIRIAGSGLAFIDFAQDGLYVQAVCGKQRICGSGTSGVQFKNFLQQIRRGDNYNFKGRPHRTERGQLSILATVLPELQSPCLQEFPTELRNQETRVRNRHVDFHVNSRAAQILQLRSNIISQIRRYLASRHYLEVQTPILANSAGGAIARAFATKAVEFPDRHIELRIAPELWLKRLVLGGFEKIFEIGPSFRNEGIDKTHNPEFTSCEFYAAYKNLEMLMKITEQMLPFISKMTNELIQERLHSLSPCGIDFDSPHRLDFLKEIENAINVKLPDLTHPDAEAEVINIFRAQNIELPEKPTLPKLLDHLSSKFLEPRCQSPTWIVHPPECLSPLSKSFVDPESKQRVAARAELFIDGKEVVNTYEEENSPFEQRRKFQDQIKYRDDPTKTDIDENYVQALEWGLPPTGGWGCGIDRLVMLFSGTDRINDVLPFGNLRNLSLIVLDRFKKMSNLLSPLCLGGDLGVQCIRYHSSFNTQVLIPTKLLQLQALTARNKFIHMMDSGGGIETYSALSCAASGRPEASIGQAYERVGLGGITVAFDGFEDRRKSGKTWGQGATVANTLHNETSNPVNTNGGVSTVERANPLVCKIGLNNARARFIESHWQFGRGPNFENRGHDSMATQSSSFGKRNDLSPTSNPMKLEVASDAPGVPMSKYAGLRSAKKRKRGSDLPESKLDGKPDDNITTATAKQRPFAPPLRRKSTGQALVNTSVVNTRLTEHGALWYQEFDLCKPWKRSELQTLSYTFGLISKGVQGGMTGQGDEVAFSILRRRLHQMEFYDFITDILVVKSKLLEDHGLPSIFDSTVFPWDLRADALMLFKKWCGRQWDPDLLRGIVTKKGTGSKETIFKTRSIDKAYPYKISANYIGEGHLVNGQWWPLQICTIRDGAHGASEGGIHGQAKKGAYSIILSGGGYADVDEGERIEYCGTSGEANKPTAYTERMLESFRLKQPVRVLRSAGLAGKTNQYRPAKGLRYDGVYDVTGYELLDKGTSMYRFTLKRCAGQDPIRYEGEESRPTPEEVYQYQKIQARLASSE
ncbi:MAG: hypothetical protein Q9170_007929, partial [Blastenia crenularia]